MPASITHAVVGEYVLRNQSPKIPVDCEGAFYGGCILIDVHAFNDIDRKITHFVGTIDEDGEKAFQQSCNHFVNNYWKLLSHPWNGMDLRDKYFVYGYLCHLAADECWRRWGMEMYEHLGLHSWSDFPFIGDLGLAAFDYLSNPLFMDKSEVVEATKNLNIPDIFKHIPLAFLEKQWFICKDYLSSSGSIEPYLEALERSGKAKKEITIIKTKFIEHWEEAIDFYEKNLGAEPFVQNSLERSMEVFALMEL
jgi:hypothetical protein